MSTMGLRQDPLKSVEEIPSTSIRLYLRNLEGEIWAPLKGNVKALVDFKAGGIVPSAVKGQTNYSSCLLSGELKSSSGE